MYRAEKISSYVVTGLVKLVTAVAYHFCLNLPATFSKPRTKKFSQLCIYPIMSSEAFLPPFIQLPPGDDSLAHSLTLSFATLLFQGTFHATVQAVMEMHKILSRLG